MYVAFSTSPETAALFTRNCCMWLFSPHLKLQHYSPGTVVCGFFHLTWNCSIIHLELLHVAFFFFFNLNWNCSIIHLELLHVAFLSHLKLQHYSLGIAACGFFHLTWNCSINHLELLHLAFFTSPETAACSRAAQWAGWWWNCAVRSWSPPGLPPPRPGLTPHVHTHRPPVTRRGGIPTGCHHPARGHREMDYSSSITQ